MKLPQFGRRYTSTQKTSLGKTHQPLTDASTHISMTQAPIVAESAGSQLGLQNLRERILSGIFFAASVLGIIIYLINMPQLLRTNQLSLLIVYGLVLIGMLLVTFIRRIPYAIRANTLLALLFVVGASRLITDGLYGNGRIFLIILPVIATILAGYRSMVGSLVLSVGTVAGVGVLMRTGYIAAPLQQSGAGNDNLVAWTIATVNFFLLSVAVTVTLSTLIRGLVGSLQQQESLSAKIEKERSQLEERVRQSTNDLQRRLLQIRTAAEITRSISALLDLEVLLPQVCEVIRDRFHLYYVGVFLLDVGREKHPAGEGAGKPGSPQYAVLAAGTGEAGQKMIAAGHKLAVGGDSMIGWATANSQARIALDVGQEAVRFSNPYLPQTRSELAIPILSKEKVLGALSIQSSEPSAFDQDDIIILQGIAGILGSAIENARLFTEVQTRLNEIQTLHRQYLARSWSDVLENRGKLEYTFQSASNSDDATLRTLQVPITLRDEVIGTLTLETGYASEAWTPEELRLIEAVTNQAALTLENVRLLEERQRQAEQQRISANISGRVWASSDIETILCTALQEIGTSLLASEGVIHLEAGPGRPIDE